MNCDTSNKNQIEAAVQRFMSESQKSQRSNEICSGSSETLDRVRLATKTQSDQFKHLLEQVPGALDWVMKNIPPCPIIRDIEWIASIAAEGDEAAFSDWEDERYVGLVE